MHYYVFPVPFYSGTLSFSLLKRITSFLFHAVVKCAAIEATFRATYLNKKMNLHWEMKSSFHLFQSVLN